MKVSIIVPNHNGEKYIRDALTSISCQTERDWECIVIDDASTDKSLDVIQEFCDADSRFKLIKFDSCCGVSAARNAGLDVARGDYIAFLDSDDAFMRDALEIFLDTAQKYQVPIVETGILPMTPNTKFNPDGFSFAAKDSEVMLFDDMLTLTKAFYLRSDEAFKMPWVWRRLWRRDIIGDLRLDEAARNQNEDMLFVLDVYHRADRVAVLLTGLVGHRAYKNSTSRNNWTSDQISGYDIVLRHMQKSLMNYKKDFRDSCQKMFVRMVMGAVLDSVRTCRNRYAIANSLARVYDTPDFPRKYLTLRQRLIVKLFIKIFAIGGKK